MPFTPCGQETDWAYSKSTVSGTHVGPAAKDHVLSCYVKLQQNIEIRLITEVVGITVLMPSEQ